MAKSIRSKAKRKLRAAKRETIAAKERLKLLAIQEQEEGIKMVQDTLENSEMGKNGSLNSGDGNKAMEVVCANQSVIKHKKIKRIKKKSGITGKNVKRLKKKRRNKYKW